MENIQKVIGEKIRQLRIEKGVKQETLARFLNKSKQAVSQLENGEVDIRISQLVKIAEFYEEDVHRLLPAAPQIIHITNCPQSTNGITNTNTTNTVNGLTPQTVVALALELLNNKEAITKLVEENNNVSS